MALAEKELYKENTYLAYNVAAIIAFGRRPIAAARNTYKKNRYTHDNYDWFSTTHAEIAALRAAKRQCDVRGASIYVMRRRKDNGMLACARPCSACLRALRDAGILWIAWTDDNGNVIWERA